MKRLFTALIVLTFLFILSDFFIRLFSPGHKINYDINTDINVTESFTNKKNEKNYKFNVTVKDREIEFFIFDDMNRKQEIIVDVEYTFNDGYFCILPIFSDEKQLTDILCEKENTVYTYTALKETSESMKEYLPLQFVSYNDSSFIIETSYKDYNDIFIYQNNVNPDHTLALTTYKGLLTFNDLLAQKHANVDIFKTDKYKREIEYFFDKYYVVADYDSELEFKTFYVVDLTSNQKDKIISKENISFDSYFQGIYKEQLYLLDPVNKKQYKLDFEDLKMEVVGDASTSIKHYNGEDLEEKNIREYADKKVLFETLNNKNIISNNETYEILYKENNKKYDLYLQAKESEIKTYLFTTANISNISIVDNTIYYFNGENLETYEINGPKRIILKYSELLVNDSFKFHAREG